MTESQNEGKADKRRLDNQDVNANVKKPVEVATADEVKTIAEESLEAVDHEKFVKVKPTVEAKKPEEGRTSEEKKPDCTEISLAAAEKSKQCGVKISESKNPVTTKKPVDLQAKKSGQNHEEGRPKEVGRPVKPKVEDRSDGEKVAECKAGKNCKWKPRCRFDHPEGGNGASVEEKPPRKIVKAAEDGKKLETKEQKVDQQKTLEEVKLVEDRDHVVEQKTVEKEKTIVKAGHFKEKKPEVKKLSRGGFPSNCKQLSAEVCHFVSPESFFLCSKEQQDKFLTLMLEIQDSQESKEPNDVLREVGTACLAFYEKDGMFYRAEIVAVDSAKNMVTVFLVDHGAKITLAGDKLRPLEPSYLEEPGCVVEAVLAGVQPLGEVWSDGDNEMAGLVLSPEIPLDVEVVGEKDGKVLVNLTDLEGNNLAGLLVEAGVAAPRELEQKDSAGALVVETGAALVTPLELPALTYGKLESGPMMVFAAASPLDLHLSTGALFEQYSDTVYPVVEEAGEKGTALKEVIGHYILKSTLVLF